MDIIKTTRIELTEEEVKEIIAEYMSKKVNKDIDLKNVSFSIGKKYADEYDDRFGTDYIKSCVVTYQDK